VAVRASHSMDYCEFAPVSRLTTMIIKAFLSLLDEYFLEYPFYSGRVFVQLHQRKSTLVFRSPIGRSRLNFMHYRKAAATNLFSAQLYLRQRKPKIVGAYTPYHAPNSLFAEKRIIVTRASSHGREPRLRYGRESLRLSIAKSKFSERIYTCGYGDWSVG